MFHLKKDNMSKEAQNLYPMHALLIRRWSPRAFRSDNIPEEKLRTLFEAARWSASGGNQQPWRFILGTNGDESFSKILDSLDDGNRSWAQNAPVLVLSVGKKTQNRNDRPNSSYRYDLGQAVAHLSIQATEEGLYVHQMGGFNPDLCRQAFSIPPDFDPITVFAVGFLGDPSQLEGNNRIRETEPRQRMAFDEFVFSGTFGQPSSLFP